MFSEQNMLAAFFPATENICAKYRMKYLKQTCFDEKTFQVKFSEHFLGIFL